MIVSIFLIYIIRYWGRDICYFDIIHWYALHLARGALHISEVLCQKQVSRSRTNNYIPYIPSNAITSPCPWYRLLKNSPFMNGSFHFATNKHHKGVYIALWPQVQLQGHLIAPNYIYRFTKKKSWDHQSRNINGHSLCYVWHHHGNFTGKIYLILTANLIGCSWI